MKKIMALLLMVILLISIMPAVGLATEPPIIIGDWSYPVDGNWADSNGATVTTLYFDELGIGTITDCGYGSISASIKTDNELEITVNDATIADGIKIHNTTATSTIIVNGNNTVISKSTETESLSAFAYGIRAYSNLVIKGANGSGDSLTVITNDDSFKKSYCIQMGNLATPDYDLLLMDNVSLNVESGAAEYESYGIRAKNINIKGCLNITASDCSAGSNSESVAIYAYDELIVEDGAVINSYSGNGKESICIKVKDFINDGNSDIKLVTENQTSGSRSHGMKVDNNINISGGSFDIALSSDFASVGVAAGKSVNISNSTFKNIDVLNSTYSFGIANNDEDITIGNSSITIHDKSEGIFAAKGSVLIGTNSDIKIYDEGVEFAPSGCAIHSEDNVVIKNSKVLASSKNAYGIFAKDDIIIDSGEVIMSSTSKYAASATNFKVLNTKANKADGSSLEIATNADLLDYSEEKYIRVGAALVDNSSPVVAPTTKTIPTVFIGEDKPIIKVLVDNSIYSSGDTSYSSKIPVIIENGRTYLGLRDMAKVLGVAPEAIKWNDKTKTASISKSGATIEVTQGSSEIKLTYGGYIYTKKSSTSAINRNDRIYLPFRVLFQIFGYTVDWDGTTRTITCK